MHMNALPPVSGGTESTLVTLGRDLLQSLTQAYVARKTGQIPPPGYTTGSQAQAAPAAAAPTPARAPANLFLFAGLGLGAVLLLRMFGKRRR